MLNKLYLPCMVVLAGVSLVLPSFILAIAVLIPLSVALPFAGIMFGFIADILFGAPSWLPAVIAYPFAISACIVAAASTLLARYLR